MADALDRRRNAYRDDLADAALEGHVDAARFATGQPYHVSVPIAPLHPEPSPVADLDTEALGGEAVQIFDVADGWAWCQLTGDGYVGYMPEEMLTAGPPAPATHQVTAREAFAYCEPTARSKPRRSWLFGSTIEVVAADGDFFELSDGGFIGRQHVKAIDVTEPDYVATAQIMLGVPYLWGGKSVRGIDCSGLVQLSLLRAGISCPRDTDMQARELPGSLPVTDGCLDQLQRGDLVYWPRHVGIMVDKERLLHANGTNMATTIDPVTLVSERSRQDGPVASAIKRLQ
ncbi:MAG: NlpC/P60 family protein [Hyphomicrobiaceae bacterium]